MSSGAVIAAGFEAVAEAVAGCGPGVAVAVWADGAWVVDLHTDGLSDQALVHTWSAIKPVTGACLLHLGIDVEMPVVEVWPEIGDERLLVRHLLTHTAGRISVPPDVPMTDWDVSVAALAASTPDWPPGSVVCEHAMTFGHLVGEVVRRIDGRSVGRVLREDLGLDDVHLGVPDDQLHRCATTVGLTDGWWDVIRGAPGSVRHRALGPMVDVNGRSWRQAEVPAVNGHATARGLASFYVGLLEGRMPAGAGRAGARGFDRFVGEDVTWSLAGGRLEDGWVGMGGLGGQWAAANPRLGVAWAFLTTHVDGPADRADHVEAALLACVA